MKQSRSISRGKRSQSTTPIKQNKIIKNYGEDDFYFCHFKNCMYMGGIKAFQKHGRGIMIHDDGTSAITSYFNDFKNGHNVLYRQNCIMSIEYQKNKVKECVLRISVYLLLIRYNNDQKPEGKASLVDYQNRKIYYVMYKKGVMTQKHQQKDPSIIYKIFNNQNIEYLIGPTHANAIKFDIDKDQNIASHKINGKFQAGFFKKGLLNGLGFIMLIKKPSSYNSDSRTNQNQLFLQIAERGYFLNGQLNGMGQKWFKNGNYYVGQFKDGVFEGNGILKNQVKKNWVYGAFQSGEMSQLIHYSHQGDVHKLNKLIQAMHEKKSNWINNQINSQSHQQFGVQIQKILKNNPTEQLKYLKDRKQQVLKKIQDNFLYDDPYDNLKSGNQKNQHFNSNQENQPNNTSNKSTNRKNGEIYKLQLGKFGQKQHQYVDSNGSYNSRYKAQFLQPVHTTKQSSSRLKQVSSRPQASATQSSRVKLSATQTKKPSTNKTLQTYQDASFALDSKRLIGRSRIFTNFNTQQQSSTSLPKFKYTPSK